ncbi:hypothetical protein A7U60_g6770 [Sanghuangporus baumii]|uniref:Uncharacterized protein n=1 Tax=Sanghuangporus baumii TaxID=108892 RepID=A0A9Q5HUI2_SANBA|nr:hypothetical protein A7U60_g6770 [Sanghuangporus baumii]
MTFTRRSLALSLSVYLACFSFRTVHARSKDGESLQLNWEKPSSGDIFGSGDTIVAQWSSEKAIVSPSVALCSQSSPADDVDDAGDCGASVWPKVSQDGHSYSFSLAVPDISSTSGFRLRVKDDFGNIVNSPTFALDPSQKSGESSKGSDDGDLPMTTSEGDSLNGESGFGSPDESSSAQTPLNDATENSGAQTGSSSSEASNSIAPGSDSERSVPSQQQHNAPAASGGSRAKGEVSSDASPVAPQTHSSPVAAGTVPTAPGAKSGSTSYDPNSGDSFPPHDGRLSRAGVPTAAIAVPISLVGATVLVSLGLCIVHRRSLAAQRARNAHLIDVQRNASVRTSGSKAPSISSGNTSKPALIDDPDIEKAIGALCGCDSRASSRQSSLRREDFVPASSHYHIPRPDVRRERTYEWPCDHDYDHNLRFGRPPSDRYVCHPSPRPSYYHPRSSFERYSRTTRGYQRRNRNNIMQTFRSNRDHDRNRDNDHDDNDDGSSSTDTILSGYVSPSIHSPMLSHRDPYLAQPRLPPRSHSRQTAPEMRYHRYNRSYDSYDADTSPYARSRCSW